MTNKNKWGLGIGDWAQSPIPNPQSPIPNPQSPFMIKVKFIDSQNGKINFVINIKIKYLNDNGEEKELEMELTLNQFY